MIAEVGGTISLFGSAQTATRGPAEAAGHRVPMQAAAPLSRSRFNLAASPRVTRAAQIARTLDQARADPRFCDHVTRADAARDRGDWIAAERDYGDALRLFPLHWGYAIQHAHAIKEQRNFPLAEAWYRSAVALGAPADMVDEHCAYVARLNGSGFVRRGMPDLAVPPLHAPPTWHDIRLLARLARVPGLAGEDLALPLLRNARDNRAVLIRLIAMPEFAPEFARSNRAFLEILRG
jgi:hypothetical protein